MQGLQISLQFTETNDGISNIIEQQQASQKKATMTENVNK